MVDLMVPGNGPEGFAIAARRGLDNALDFVVIFPEVLIFWIKRDILAFTIFQRAAMLTDKNGHPTCQGVSYT